MFEYLKSRGFGIDIIKKFGLKEKEKYVMIPYFNQYGKIMFYKCRSKYSKKFWYHPKGSCLTIYNCWNLASYKDYVVITEGEIDCLTLLQFGINAVGSPGAGLFKKNWVNQFSHTGKIYIAFDNDLAGIEGAIKLAEDCFSDRDTYNILIPKIEGAKDINDLLTVANYKKEDFQKLISDAIRYEPKNIEKKKKKQLKVNKFILGSVIGELIYSKESGEGRFTIFDNISNKFEVLEKYEVNGKLFVPDVDDKLIENNVIRIPQYPCDYGSTGDLLSDVHKFLNKYVDICDDLDRDIVVTYVLLTWVYDRFSSIPYLRILGDYGTGKSRLLKVLNICYKSIYTSTNASSSPIFRLIDKYGGTLIIDEAELGKRTDKNEDIKEILRFGKDSDGVVLRCDGPSFSPNPYRVFGPKVLGSRRTYSDDALESRIIDIKMKETKADHIPIILDKEEFDKDSDRIRGKLLKWRLENYSSIDNKVYEKYQSSIISKRLNEMNAPLICVRSSDEDFIYSLTERAKEKQKGLTQDKSMSLEANIVKEIERLYLDKNQRDPLLRDIAENISEKTNRKYSPRFIGSLVRNNLNLATDHTREGNVVIFNSQKIEQLKRDYFI